MWEAVEQVAQLVNLSLERSHDPLSLPHHSTASEPGACASLALALAVAKLAALGTDSQVGVEPPASAIPQGRGRKSGLDLAPALLLDSSLVLPVPGLLALEFLWL